MAGRRKKKADIAPQQLLAGRRPVAEVLRHAPERVAYLLVGEGVSRTGRAAELLAAAEAAKVQVQFVSPAELSALVGSERHQSFAVSLQARPPVGVGDVLKAAKSRTSSLVLVLDGIADPQNFGALLRAGECFGVDGVVWSRNRSTGLTPAAKKVSVGACELLRLVEVGNLKESLIKIKKDGYWAVAADAHGGERAGQFEFPEKTALIVGSEEKGISRLLLSESDFAVHVPMAGVLDSLNVSQAAAVLMHSYRLQYPSSGS